MAQFDKFDVMTTTLGAAVATGQTITFTYPTKSPARAAASYAATGGILVAAQGMEGVFLQQALGFSAVYGASTVVVTYLGLTTLPAGTQVSLQAPTVFYDDITDNSTGTVGRTVAAGAGVTTLSFPVDLTSFTTGALDLVTTYLPGYKFKILDLQYVVGKVGTGAGATQSINAAITGVNVTGGVVNPTLANAATMGAKVAGTAITALNTGSVTDTISIKCAAGGTVFTAGAGVLLMKLQNMDTADAIASVIDSENKANARLRAREIFPGQVAN